MKLLKLLICLLLMVEGIYAKETILIGASAVPHAEILKKVKPILLKQGIDLQIREFSEYVQPNLFVEQKQLDANFFQHRPYLIQFNKEHNTHLVELVGVQIEPMGLYLSSNTNLVKFAKSMNLADLPKGLNIGVPSDTTNEGRALLLLQANGIIEINKDVIYPTKKDIKYNPYNIIIKELDPAMLSRTLKDKGLDMAVINSNYVLLAKMNPLKDAIFIEGSKSPYVNIVAVRNGEESNPKMKALAKALHTLEVRDFINQTYQGAVVPSF